MEGVPVGGLRVLSMESSQRRPRRQPKPILSAEVLPETPYRHSRYASALVRVVAGVNVVAVVREGECWSWTVEVEAVDELGGVEWWGKL